MFVWIRRLAKILHSPTLETTAADNLCDVLTSTAAFIGIVGSDFIHHWLTRCGFFLCRVDLLGRLYGAVITGLLNLGWGSEEIAVANG
jgi:hypothetical protein